MGAWGGRVRVKVRFKVSVKDRVKFRVFGLGKTRIYETS